MNQTQRTKKFYAVNMRLGSFTQQGVGVVS